MDNAETYGCEDECDVALLCYVLHEAPEEGRRALVANAMRIARRSVYIMDIAPSYQPSQLMLTGEPYLLDYLSNIDNEVADAALRTRGLVAETLANGRVAVYNLIL